MNGYLVFKFDRYCPDGGWDDFHAAYGSKEEAVKVAMALVTNKESEIAQVVDLSTLKMIGDVHRNSVGTYWRLREASQA